MSVLDRDAVAEIVEEQVDLILRARGSMPFTADYQELIEKHDAQLQGMLADRSLGRIINGPTWISGTSVLDGTITAPKISVNTLEAVQTSTGSLNVTGTFTAAASFPATGARVVISSAGLWGYSGAATTTFKLNVDGSGEIGTGSNKVTWDTSGAVTIPTATISNLTIAAVGGGVLGGSYVSATTGGHIKISTDGILAFNATTESAATQTFFLNALTGAVAAIGSYTIRSSATGAMVEISSAGGIEGKNSGGASTFLLNAADGTGRLGKVGSGLSWDSSGNVSVDGSLLVNSTVTATKLSVSTLSAVSADAGTITAGSITASVITAGTFLNGSGGTINVGAADVVVNSTGKLKFGSGDYLDNNLLHFEVGSTETASVEFKNSSNTPYNLINALATTTFANIILGASNGSGSTARASFGADTAFASCDVRSVSGSNNAFVSASSNTTSTFQTINLGFDTSNFVVTVRPFQIDVTKPISYPGSDTSAAGSYYGRVPVVFNGLTKYMHLFNA